MKNLNHLFVPYVIALKLKDLGFKEYCFGIYDDKGYLYTQGAIYSYLEDETNIIAPLHQQVIDWIREKHSIRIVEDIAKNSWSSNGHDTDFKFNVIKVDGASTKDMLYACGLEGLYYPSYYEAMQKAIEFALTKIS